MNRYKQLIFILLASVIVNPIGLHSQINDEFGNFLEDHFEGGEKEFLNIFYKNINYPRAARLNCGIGHLHVRLTLKETGGLLQIDYLNQFGYGVEQDVTNVLKITNNGWVGVGEKKVIEFSIAYQLGGNPKIKGDIKVTGYSVDDPEADSGCLENKEILRKIKKAISKEKFKKVPQRWNELIRRGDKTEEFLKLQEIHGKDFSKISDENK